MFKRSLLKIFVVVTGLLLFPGAVYAQEENPVETDWQITNFDTQITINEDATASIKETIAVDFYSYKHGIYREIPKVTKTTNFFSPGIRNKISLLSVTDESGTPYEFTTTNYLDHLKIKIGDPDVTISGEHSYVIEYTIDNIISYYDDHDEFYWNSTGDKWPVSIASASTVVTYPSDVNPAEIDYTCFTGAYGSTEKDCTFSKDGNTVTILTMEPLNPYEGYSVVLAVPQGTFDKPGLWERHGYSILISSGISFPFFTFIGLYGFWRKNGKDAAGKDTIVPSFFPPDQLSPAEVGLLMDNSVDNLDLTASVIDLAIKGYIKITEGKKLLGIGKNYKFTLMNPDYSSQNLKQHEKLIIEGIFGSSGKKGDEVSLSKLKNKFYHTANKFKDTLNDSMVTAGYFTKHPRMIMTTMIVIGSILLFASFFVTAGFLFAVGGILTGIGCIISSIMIIVSGFFMPQRTSKGTAAYEESLGLKMYIEIAEKDRIDKMQSPDSEYVKSNEPEPTVELFEKLLPYAIVMKVESKWAKKFEKIYTQPPEWYSGANWNTFNTYILVSSLNNATSSMTSSFVSSPRSSGSGFGGGGFSGGGFGGGGGGSW